METIAPFVHDSAQCFTCTQYRLYFDEFCRINDIEVVFGAVFYPAQIFAKCGGGKLLVIRETSPLFEWLPLAYELVGLPCLNFYLTDGSVHFGQFLSMN